MKVLLVEPLGHMGGHCSSHTKYLSQALADAGVDVTLLTFDGLLGEPAAWSAEVRHISFISTSGAFAPAWRFLCSHLPPSLSPIPATVCGFRLAVRWARREKNAVIDILDAYPHDFAPVCFASIVNRRRLISTLHLVSREAEFKNWQARFREVLRKREIRRSFGLCLSGLLGTRPAAALKRLLYRRAARTNHLAFICYTKAVHDSYSNSPFYGKIVPMLYGVAMPEQAALTPLEARQRLGLPQDEPVFLHFGLNHLSKNLEVIFQAAKDLPPPYKLLFAGQVYSSSDANNPLSLVRKYGLGQTAIIVDRYILEQELPDYFYSADAVILSYRTDFQGASGVLSAAAQFNVPVIASDVGEIGEAVKNSKLGLTFEAENPESLRDTISAFLGLREEEKREMKENLSRFAQDRSYQELARRHIELYQSLSSDNAA